MDTYVIKLVNTDEEILCCFPVMQELRAHLSDAKVFLQRVRQQQSQGYLLLAVWQEGQPIALAGYRYQHNLVHGLFAYVDDLITTASMRRHRYGQLLLEYIFYEASKQGCNKVVLDTGLANSLAQRFYHRMGMLAMGLHFSFALNEV